jgi:hypothetical protein
MARISDLIETAEEVGKSRAARRQASYEQAATQDDGGLYINSDPSTFPNIPDNATEVLRQEMREMALSSHYYFCKVVLGYNKLRVEPHGELCAFLDFCEDDEEANRTIVFMPRDTYKTTICTIGRACKRGCKDPNTRGLILADTGLNAIRFGIEIKNHFQFNRLLQWLFPEVIPDNFNTIRWNAKELVLKRTAPWRDPTFDMMGGDAGVESRHYDWIIPDDLVTEKHIHSDVEMDKLIAKMGGLEPLLVNDVLGRIDFVGSRKRKDDAYEHVLKYYGGESQKEHEVGPHATRRGSIYVYSRKVIEEGKIIFPFDKDKKSGISRAFLIRLRTNDPERYHAQYENNPKGSGLTWFDSKDLRYFRMGPDKIIEAYHEGKLVERVSAFSLQRIVMYDPSVAEKKTSSKQAILVIGKRETSPYRYLLEAHYGHILPDEAMKLLFSINTRWQPDFFSIEKRGFQGWVKYSLDLIAETHRPRLPYIPVMEYPPLGSERGQWAKKEHIRTLQSIFRNHLMWFNAADDGQADLISDVDFYPGVKWDDGLDALAQQSEWWPFTWDEAEMAANDRREFDFLMENGQGSPRLDFNGPARGRFEPFDEQAFLAQMDASGYGMKQVFIN